MVFSLSLTQAVFADPSDVGTPASSDSTDSASTSSSEPALDRWLNLDALSFSLRCRNSDDTQGTHAFNDLQQRVWSAADSNFDKEGKYVVEFRAESGRYFNWSYANISGLSYKDSANAAFDAYTPQRQALVLNAFYHDPLASEILNDESAQGWQFYVRDLYLSATPVKAVTFEFGAIPFERGAG
jgi:hypothetical protein